MALRDLSFSIDTGEHVAILGPNGSGKSTLIKVITRECYSRQPGRVRIWGEERWGLFDLRALLGIVTNDLVDTCTKPYSALETALSGFFGSIGIWPNHHVTPEMERVATAVMAQLDTTHLACRWLDELSSGEARRLLIARALIHNPQTLLLDEPTTSLDLSGLHELRGHLRALAQQGVGIVLVTHHLDDIVPEIDRVTLLRDGQVYRDGPKQHILSAGVLSDTFRVQVEVVVRDGFYHAW